MISNTLKIVLVTLMTFLVLTLGNFGLALSCADCSTRTDLSAQEAAQCGTSCASNNNQDPTKATQEANGTIKTAVNLLSVVGGLAAIVMIIIGGFRYITSGGKQESVTSAKNTILYALIGLVIIALAQVFVRFVLTSLSK